MQNHVNVKPNRFIGLVGQHTQGFVAKFLIIAFASLETELSYLRIFDTEYQQVQT